MLQIFYLLGYLANMTSFIVFFFYFALFFNSFFTISVEIENARLKLALVIPTGASTPVENDAIEILPVVKDKIINDI